MRSWWTSCEAETRAVGEELAAELIPDGVLLLAGELGSGKTTLVRGLAAGLGLDPREIQSPSYTLMREHAGPRGRLIHVDLYRLTPREASAVGLDEVFAGPGVKAVEWPDRLPFAAPTGLCLELARRADGGREIAERDPRTCNDGTAEVR